MLKIVIIENERLVRKGLILTFDWEEMNSIIVGEASNGEEGIAVIQDKKPDIVITDIRMPEMDGLQMIEQLQKEGIDSEYIIISGYDDFKYAQTAIRLGVVDFLLKPINEQELAVCLDKIQERIEKNIKTKKLVHKISHINESPYILFEKYFENYSLDARETLITNTIDFIKTNIASDLSINTISEYLQVSTGHLSRSFKKSTGYTILEYITFARIKKAIDYLENTDYHISEIAYAVGFNDPKYFSHVFRKNVGVTPTEFRNRLN